MLFQWVTRRRSESVKDRGGAKKKEDRPRLLLHTCCGPCALGVIDRLKNDYEITCYFYNPNIHPEAEYGFRLDQAREMSKITKVSFIDDEYDIDIWFEKAKGLENEPEGGKRCEICFLKRLQRTGGKAKLFGADYFATTLTIGPQKNATLINAIGKRVSMEVGVAFLEGDWKKNEGFKRSVELSRKYGLIRQDYCGCKYSR